MKAFAAAVVASLSASALAATYPLTQIMPAQAQFTRVYSPAVNNNGDLAFAGLGSGTTAVYRYSEGVLQQVSPAGYSNFNPNHMDIADSGDIYYTAQHSGGSAVMRNGTRLYSSTNTTAYTLTGVQVNGAGQVAFVQDITGAAGFYRGDGTATTKVFTPSIMLANTRPTINAAGVVGVSAIRMAGATGYAAIYKCDGVTSEVVIDGSDPDLNIVTDPWVDTQGRILFKSDFDSGTGVGLFLQNGATRTTIVDPRTSDFMTVPWAGMNANGLYAFLGVKDDSSRAIYVGREGSLERIIGLDDQVDGMTVTRLEFTGMGISDDGKVAFTVGTSLGEFVYAVQTPEPAVLAFAVIACSALLRPARRVTGG